MRLILMLAAVVLVLQGGAPPVEKDKNATPVEKDKNRGGPGTRRKRRSCRRKCGRNARSS